MRPQISIVFIDASPYDAICRHLAYFPEKNVWKRLTNLKSIFRMSDDDQVRELRERIIQLEIQNSEAADKIRILNTVSEIFSQTDVTLTIFKVI